MATHSHKANFTSSKTWLAVGQKHKFNQCYPALFLRWENSCSSSSPSTYSFSAYIEGFISQRRRSSLTWGDVIFSTEQHNYYLCLFQTLPRWYLIIKILRSLLKDVSSPKQLNITKQHIGEKNWTPTKKNKCTACLAI